MELVGPKHSNKEIARKLRETYTNHYSWILDCRHHMGKENAWYNLKAYGQMTDKEILASEERENYETQKSIPECRFI